MIYVILEDELEALIRKAGKLIFIIEIFCCLIAILGKPYGCFFCTGHSTEKPKFVKILTIVFTHSDSWTLPCFGRIEEWRMNYSVYKINKRYYSHKNDLK